MKAFWLWMGIALVSFHLAYLVPAAGGVILFYLLALHALICLAPSHRYAFYGTFVLGIATIGPHLWFFVGLFGPLAFLLWCILALWLASFAALTSRCIKRWPNGGLLLLPVLYLAFEYARSELYALKFSWLIPGYALSGDSWRWLTASGVYGVSFLALLVFSSSVLLYRKKWLISLFGICLTLSLTIMNYQHKDPLKTSGPLITGIQIEEGSPDELLRLLELAESTYPDSEIFVLGEYAFSGDIPVAFRKFCQQEQVYLIAGGADHQEESYYNTAFVVGPDGTIIHSQAKSTPIQFFNDGKPAHSQKVWHSPWGDIGLAICYDMSYAEVIDSFRIHGARAMIIPTMDAIKWGAYEHSLHGKVAPVRSREYGMPIFRLGTSGISQLTDATGCVVAKTGFPDQNAFLHGELMLSSTVTVPFDRDLAKICIGATMATLVYFSAINYQS